MRNATEIYLEHEKFFANRIFYWKNHAQKYYFLILHFAYICTMNSPINLKQHKLYYLRQKGGLFNDESNH